jgi:hypothetical protein
MRNEVLGGQANTLEGVTRKSVTIVRAKFGTGKDWADVTEQVRKLVKDSKLHLVVPREGNTLQQLGFPDPAPNRLKQLEVFYSVNGKEYNVTGEAGQELSLPPMSDDKPSEDGTSPPGQPGMRRRQPRQGGITGNRISPTKIEEHRKAESELDPKERQIQGAHELIKQYVRTETLFRNSYEYVKWYSPLSARRKAGSKAEGKVYRVEMKTSLVVVGGQSEPLRMEYFFFVADGTVVDYERWRKDQNKGWKDVKKFVLLEPVPEN